MPFSTRGLDQVPVAFPHHAYPRRLYLFELLRELDVGSRISLCTQKRRAVVIRRQNCKLRTVTLGFHKVMVYRQWREFSGPALINRVAAQRENPHLRAIGDLDGDPVRFPEQS